MNHDEAKNWLLENGWNEHPEFDNYLTRNPLELIVMGEDGVWYWEDERKSTGVRFKSYPVSEYELKDFVI